MTQYLEDFTTDPLWTEERGTYTHDNTNGEMEIDSTSGYYYIRSPNAPGNIEHECQGTFLSAGANNSGWQSPVAVRGLSGGMDNYSLEFETGAGTGGVLYLVRRTGAGDDFIYTNSTVDIDLSTFYTVRLAAEGGNGANVVLSIWIQNHGGTKPSDPGWIGVDDSPDYTYTDSAAARLDDDTVHLYCGVGGYETTAYDQRIDFHKIRAVSDRSAGGATALPFRMRY